MTPEQEYDDLRSAASETYVEMTHSVYFGAVRLLASGRYDTPQEAVNAALETYDLAMNSVPNPSEILDEVLGKGDTHEED